MHVQIFSMMAASCGSPNSGPMWIGTLPTGKVGRYSIAVPVQWNDPKNEDQVNDILFRYFNRVHLDDDDRLAAIGYNLPSMSVGDFVSWGGNTYRVMRAGFEKVTGTEAGVNLIKQALIANSIKIGQSTET